MVTSLSKEVTLAFLTAQLAPHHGAHLGSRVPTLSAYPWHDLLLEKCPVE